jgi:phosphomannomutase
MLKSAVVSGLLATGCTILDADIAATPTCGVLVQEHQAAGGIEITASHNPVEWNGLKPFSGDGSVFDAAQGRRLLDLMNARSFAWAGCHRIGRVEPLAHPSAPHLKRVLGLVDVGAIRKARLKVVLDSNHGSGSVLGRELLEALGCDVHTLGAIPDGQFEHHPEPLAENLTQLCREVVNRGADIGFAQDPDADRLAIVDERGTYIGEELTLALCADFLLPQRRGAVVVNGSTSRTTADIAARHGCPFYRSYVGEAHVVAKMKSVGAVLGGEGNGGLIEPRVGYVRDSFAAMACILGALAAGREPLSHWVASLPRYTIVKDKVDCPPSLVSEACAALKRHFNDAAAEEGDGLRLDWPDRWVQLRSSNTEPIARVIAEARDPATARALCDQALAIVADHVKRTGN